MRTEITTQTENILDAVKMAHFGMITQHQGRGVLFINRAKDWENLANDKYVKENFNVYPVRLSKWQKNNITDVDSIKTKIELMHFVLLAENRTKESQKPDAPSSPDEVRSTDNTKPIIFLTGRGFERPELEEELQQYFYN